MLVVPDQTYQKFIAKMEQFFGEGAIRRNLFAVEDKLQYLQMDVLGIQHALLHVVTAISLVSKVKQGLLSQEVGEP